MASVDISIRNARLRHAGDALVDIAIARPYRWPGASLRVEAGEEIDAGGGLVTPSYVNPHLAFVQGLDLADDGRGGTEGLSRARHGR